MAQLVRRQAPPWVAATSGGSGGGGSAGHRPAPIGGPLPATHERKSMCSMRGGCQAATTQRRASPAGVRRLAALGGCRLTATSLQTSAISWDRPRAANGPRSLGRLRLWALGLFGALGRAQRCSQLRPRRSILASGCWAATPDSALAAIAMHATNKGARCSPWPVTPAARQSNCVSSMAGPDERADSSSEAGQEVNDSFCPECYGIVSAGRMGGRR